MLSVVIMGFLSCVGTEYNLFWVEKVSFDVDVRDCMYLVDVLGDFWT
jgi:hypothetical protein